MVSPLISHKIKSTYTSKYTVAKFNWNQLCLYDLHATRILYEHRTKNAYSYNLNLNKKKNDDSADFKALGLVGIVDLFFNTVQFCIGRPTFGQYMVPS